MQDEAVTQRPPRDLRKARRWRPLVLLATLLLLGACGSPAEEGWVNEGPPLAADEFVERGNQICRDLSAELTTILADGTGEDGFVSAEAYEAMDAARTTSFGQLFILRPPAELEDDFQKLQEIRQEFEDVGGERIPEPDIDLRLGPEWEETATALNLTDCIS